MDNQTIDQRHIWPQEDLSNYTQKDYKLHIEKCIKEKSRPKVLWLAINGLRSGLLRESLLRKVEKVINTDLYLEIVDEDYFTFRNKLKDKVQEGSFKDAYMLCLYLSCEPLTGDKLIYLLTAESFEREKGNEYRANLLSELIDFHLNNITDLKKIVTNGFTQIIQQSSKKKYLNRFMDLLFNYGMDDIIHSTFWYFKYLKNTEVTDKIEELCNKHQKPIDFSFRQYFNRYSWATFPLDSVISRFNTLQELKIETTDQKRKNNIADTISAASLTSLIPSIFYARIHGDIEIEAYLLWHALKQSTSESLSLRMSELSGYKIPEEFVKLKERNERVSWLSNTTKHCNMLFGGNHVDHRNLTVLKKVYSVQPFSSIVLRSLIKVNFLDPRDSVVMDMISNTIEKCNSESLLGKMLGYSITLENEKVFQNVILKMSTLGYFKTIHNSVKKVVGFLKKDSPAKQLSFLALNFAHEALSHKNGFDHSAKYDQLKLKHTRFKNQSSVKSVVSDLNSTIDRMFDSGKHAEIGKILSNPNLLSEEMLEFILRKAIKYGYTQWVVESYQCLAQKNSRKASYFNFEVEEFFVFFNKDKKERKTNNGLSSGIWGIPVLLENPINKLATYNK